MCLPYWQAFGLLNESRTMASAGMGGVFPMPIPYSELSVYARDHGLADSYADLDEFVYLIGKMDRTYLDHVSAKK